MTLFSFARLAAPLFFLSSLAAAALPPVPAPVLEAKAWLLVDVQSGQALAAKDADARLEPASLTKLMTAYLSLQALKEGRLRLDQPLPVSAKAWRAEGSRMFLEVGKSAKVEDLLKGMIVQSGNDACIVLAEGIAGSEEAFVKLMNEQARRLGMTASQFANATGLPMAGHYSTARDLARLTAALIRDFPHDYAAYYSLMEFTYSGISQPNRNRLLWLDPHVDGVKTGHTDSAGYCLIASALRDKRRLVSVVLGAKDDLARARESQKLLNHGFQHFETVKLYEANRPVTELRLYKGSSSKLDAGFPYDFHVTVPRGAAAQLQAQIITQQPMLAPVSRGQKVGVLRLSLAGKHYADYPLMALKTISLAGMIGRGWDSLMLLFH
jgi:D-alanyl-D-alanine carboxypeptidase (penicillin-binding protein 5/6)